MDPVGLRDAAQGSHGFISLISFTQSVIKGSASIWPRELPAKLASAGQFQSHSRQDGATKRKSQEQEAPYFHISMLPF